MRLYTVIKNELRDFKFEDLRYILFTDIEDLNEHKKILSIRNHPVIRANMYNDKEILFEEHLKFLEFLNSSTDKLYWAVYDKDSLIGAINITEINFEHSRCKLGIYSDPTLKGYGKKLIRCLKYIVFDKFGFDVLRLEVLESNHKAIEFYEKNNFKFEGKLRNYIKRKDFFINVLIYSITKEEYLNEKFE